MNPIARNGKDFWAGVLFIVVGVAAIVLSRDYGMGSAGRMGPAFFPAVLSGLLIIIGTVSIIRAFIKPGTAISRFAVKGLLLVTFSTLLFGLIVRGAGLIVALPLLVLISAYASTRFRWPYALALALGVTVFCILVFRIGLGVPLPIVGDWFVD